ncbi:hypothetical protein HK100_009647 [Physocladia obscura]|uniref:Mitochondrial carrier protein n=1 Tax=Physocladia obscura TaxID=109957 RepID=A0AAD5XB00_9FUNG|nr:hypothetical protein HK100_009647 [Physocladia obscura]
MGGHASDKGDESLSARLLGSGFSGILELVCFHPVDTIAKRLMNSTQKPFGNGQSLSQGFSILNETIFRDAAHKGTFTKYKSLFPGLGFAAGYKVAQRMYKFTGQRHVKDYMNNNHASTFKSLFGDNWKTMMHATAGSIVGVGEIVLLPLDALKIKMQINPAGASWTAARNAPGSFALFGGSAFVKENIFELKDYSQATFFQNFCASIGGAFASITVSSPLDVIKTRIQAKSVDKAEGGWSILSKMVKNEGFGSFFKGLVPKLLVVGPKLVFSFTIADMTIPLISKVIDEKKN